MATPDATENHHTEPTHHHPSSIVIVIHSRLSLGIYTMFATSLWFEAWPIHTSNTKLELNTEQQV